jgi:hypothetical protein
VDGLPLAAPVDLLGRPLRDLRVSVTDRCNLRCRYCMPREVFGEDFPFLERDELLTFEEIERLVRVRSSTSVSARSGSPAASRCCAATSPTSSRGSAHRRLEDSRSPATGCCSVGWRRSSSPRGCVA